MDDYYKLLGEKYSKLIESEFVCFTDVSLKKNVTGVYIVYSDDNKVIYIGSTNKFDIRFGTDLKHEATHTLMKKLLKSEIYPDRKLAKDFLQNICRFKIEVCSSKREAEALEHFAIWALNPQYNK